MKTIIKLEDLTTIDQLENFRSGTPAVACSVRSDKDACYRWIQPLDSERTGQIPLSATPPPKQKAGCSAA